MTAKLKLISHALCPYVQRAVIALTEKGVPFERIDIDLSNKPDWFLKLSPLGKVPVLQVGDKVVFESAVILEYLEETLPNPLHPKDPLTRAEHRAWIEFGSAVLGDIWGLETISDEAAFKTKAIQAISMCSTRSAISAFLTIDRRSRAGGKVFASARQYDMR